MADMQTYWNVADGIIKARKETYAMLAKYGITLSDEPNQAEIDAASAAMLRAGNRSNNNSFASDNSLSVDDILRGI